MGKKKNKNHALHGKKVPLPDAEEDTIAYLTALAKQFSEEQSKEQRRKDKELADKEIESIMFSIEGGNPKMMKGKSEKKKGEERSRVSSLVDDKHLLERLDNSEEVELVNSKEVELGNSEEVEAGGSGLSIKDKISLEIQTVEQFQPPLEHIVECLIEAKIKNSGDSIFNGYVKMGTITLEASFIPCSDDQFEHFEELRNLGLACPQILTPFQVIASDDQNYLVLEPLEMVQDFFNRKYQKFLYENNWNDLHFHNLEKGDKLAAMAIWWEKISGDFYTIFRDVVKSLLFLYGKNQLYPCGNLGRNIYVSLPRKSGIYEDVIEIQAKNLPSMISTNNFMEDAHELMETMKSVVFPTSWQFNVEMEDECPYFEVCHYLQFISYNEILMIIFSLGLLTTPFFGILLNGFFFMKEMGKFHKINRTITCVLGNHFYRSCPDFHFPNTWKLSVKDPLLKAILEKPNSSYVTPYGTEEDIIRFFNACYAHANENEYAIHRKGQYLGDNVIEEKLICTFPNIYVWIKDGLLNQAISDNKLVGKVLKILPGIKHLL